MNIRDYLQETLGKLDLKDASFELLSFKDLKRRFVVGLSSSKHRKEQERWQAWAKFPFAGGTGKVKVWALGYCAKEAFEKLDQDLSEWHLPEAP